MSVLFITCPPLAVHLLLPNAVFFYYLPVFLEGSSKLLATLKNHEGHRGHELGQSIIVHIMTENGSFNLVGLPRTGDGLMRAPSIFPATGPSGVSSTPKA